MEDREEILKKLKSAKADLQAKFPIAELALFGSYSRGTNHQGSDIDILFHPRQDAFFGLKETVDLLEYFQRLFSAKKVDVVNKKYINPIIEFDIEDSLIYV